jgi:hypothetical protein
MFFTLWVLNTTSDFLLLYLCCYSRLLSMLLSFSLVVYLLCLVLRAFSVFGPLYLHDVLHTCCLPAGIRFLYCFQYWVIQLLVILAGFLYVFFFFSLFTCFPFLCIPVMSILSVIVTYLCPVLSMCCMCLFVGVVSPSFVLCSAF